MPYVCRFTHAEGCTNKCLEEEVRQGKPLLVPITVSKYCPDCKRLMYNGKMYTLTCDCNVEWEDNHYG